MKSYVVAAESGSETPIRLAVIVTHPIQYFSPWWRSLAARADVELMVVYLRQLDQRAQGTDFGVAFQWDIPLLQGYRWFDLQAGNGWRAVAVLPRLIREIRSWRADVVLIMGWQEPALALTIPAIRVLGLPSLVRGDSNDLKPRPRAIRVVHRVIGSLVSGALAVGRSNARLFTSMGICPKQVFPSPHFVENERLFADAERHDPDAVHLRSAEGAGNGDVVFAFCGKLVPFKRPDLLVEAAGRLVRDGLPVRLRIAGSGELRDALAERARALGVPIHFTGFLNQTEMWRAYVGADVFVLPSTTRETWGLVTNEAMVFGLPVIVSRDAGCAEDLVIEDVTGWTFSGGVEELAEAMRHAITQRDRLKAMGAAARRHVIENYSMDVATRGLMQAIEAVRR